MVNLSLSELMSHHFQVKIFRSFVYSSLFSGASDSHDTHVTMWTLALWVQETGEACGAEPGSAIKSGLDETRTSLDVRIRRVEVSTTANMISFYTRLALTIAQWKEMDCFCCD